MSEKGMEFKDLSDSKPVKLLATGALKKEDTLGDMIEKKFGIHREDFVKNEGNLKRLAKMADVKDDEYTVGDITLERIIKQKILAGKVEQLQTYEKALYRFSSENQNAIISKFNEDQIDSYFGNLDEESVVLLDKLSPDQLVVFIQSELEGTMDAATAIEKQVSANASEKDIENLTNRLRVIDLQNRLNKFLMKYNLSRYKINMKTNTFEHAADEAEFQKYIKGIQTDESTKKKREETLKSCNGDKKLAEMTLRAAYAFDKTKSSDEFAKLIATNSDAKKEFDEMATDLYLLSQKMHINLSDFGLGKVFSDAVQYMVDIYVQDDFSVLANKASIDDDVRDFFAENKITELVKEEGKNKEYYKNLLLLYPKLNTEIGGKNISEYLEYFDDDMTIKKPALDGQEEKLTLIMAGLREQAKEYENRLLDKTNVLTKDVAINQCISVLGRFMDVDVDAKENIVKQFKLSEYTHAEDVVSEDLTLHINGTINGKKVKVSYDLKTGKVYCSNMLYRDPNKEDGIITLDGKAHAADEVPLTMLPTLETFTQEAKDMDYKTLISGCESLDDYTAKFTEKLEQSVMFPNAEGMKNQQDTLRKSIVKNAIVQDIYSLTGRVGMDDETTSLNAKISTERYPQIHAMYNLLYRSMEYYTIDQLQLFQKNIKKMVDYRNVSTNLNSYKNIEEFVIKSMSHTTIIPNNQANLNDQGPEELFLQFFKSFEKNVSGVAIIDVRMLDDCFKTSEQEAASTTIGTWKRDTTNFTILSNTLQSKITGHNATADLPIRFDEAQDLPENEK